MSHMSDHPSQPYGPLHVSYDDRVLAPRPWTMAQADWAAALWPGGPVLELCCGVGHIGLALAHQLPAPVVMVDSSPVACEFAEHNAAQAGLEDRVEVRCGSLDSAVEPDERFSLILADPPWVPTQRVPEFPEDPAYAIDGGHDGLGLVRECIDVIAEHLTDDGDAVLQIGPGQSNAVRDYLDNPLLGLVARTCRTYGERGTLVRITRRR